MLISLVAIKITSVHYHNDGDKLKITIMKKQQLILLVVFSMLLISQNTLAQIVEIESRTDGFLLPVMTTPERDAIESPRDGLIIWNEDVGRLNYFEAGFGWAELYRGTPLEYFLSLPNGIQTLLNAGETPLNIINAGASLTDFIGLNHAGGIIFYMDPSGNGTGLVAAPSDQSAGAEWGCIVTLIVGADGTVIGTGNQNTIDIEAGCTTSGTAADICANLSLGGFTDWFLPSKDELNEMYTKIGQGALAPKTNIGNFADSFYWSSSEFDDFSAWRQNFVNAFQSFSSKSNNLQVRAIRAF